MTLKTTWLEEAWDEYVYWQSQDRKTLRKINLLIRDIKRSGGKGTGKAELLKGNLSGCASVKIDAKNRLVYRVRGEKGDQHIEILQCGCHYGDN